MSAFERVGDVQYVNEKDGRYSFKLDDEKWYGCGEQKPEFVAGDRIKFGGKTNEKNGVTYYNLDHETVKVKKGEGVVKPYKKSGGGGKSTAESKAYWDKRTKMDEERVIFEKEKHIAIGEYSVRNSALAYLDILMNVGGLPIGKLKTAAAIHKAMDACLDAIIEQFSGQVPGLDVTDVKDESDDFDEPTTVETTGEDNGKQEEW